MVLHSLLLFTNWKVGKCWKVFECADEIVIASKIHNSLFLNYFIREPYIKMEVHAEQSVIGGCVML